MKSYTKRNLLGWETLSENAASTDIVLLLHGMNCGPNTIGNLVDAIEESRKKEGLPEALVLVPKLPFIWHQCADLKKLSEEIVDHLNGLPGISEITSLTIVGHSAGGVIAQAVYMISRDQPDKSWGLSGSQIRLVLIAPINQGWTISHHLPLSKKISWTIGVWLLPLVYVKEFIRAAFHGDRQSSPWITQLRRGSPFLVWLRLRWLEAHGDLPCVVQLLGSIDEIISWRDMVDTGSGAHFLYLEVPYSDHVTILNFEGVGEEKEAIPYGEQRREIFQHALTLKPEDPQLTIQPWDTAPVPPEPQVERVVFVIHGIRDEGHWTQKIGLEVRKKFTSDKIEELEERGKRKLSTEEKQQIEGQVAIITSSYGYFSMLEFLTYWKRRDKIHWLADKYVEARRRYPSAEFSYIAHSNGTYLLAHALDIYPDFRFERVAFAGSVVSSKFNWEKIFKADGASSRVTSSARKKMIVVNFTATYDWVVGFIPMIADVIPLQWLLGKDLGGAGVVPFEEHEQVKAYDAKKGAHGAAIQENNWATLANFAVTGDVPVVDPTDESCGEPLIFFKKPLIWGICVIILLVAISLVVCALPWLAYVHPIGFWGGIGTILLTGGLLLTLLERSLEQKPIAKRLKLRKLAGPITVITFVVLALWLCAGFVSLIQGTSWIWEFPETYETFQTLSVVIYLMAIWKILTKV